MRLSKKTDYGFRALIFLARNPGKMFSARVISQETKVPLAFLEKLLVLFEKSNLVKVKKGREGGYMLFKDPKKINVAKILSLLEKEVHLLDCLSGKKQCNFYFLCQARNFWKKIDQKFLKMLKGFNLLQMIKQ